MKLGHKAIAYLLSVSMLVGILGTGASAEEVAAGETSVMIEEFVEATAEADVDAQDDAEVQADTIEDTADTTDEGDNVIAPEGADENVVTSEDNNGASAQEDEAFEEMDTLMTMSVDAGEELTASSSALTSGTYTVPDDGLTIDGYLTIAAGEEVVIDLNGQDLTINFADTENETDYDDAGIVNSGTLTVKDSTGGGTYTAVSPTDDSISSSTYTTFAAIHNKAGGTLNLEKGTIKVTCDAGDRKTYGVYSTSSTESELNLTGADIVATSGTSTTTKYTYGVYASYHDVNMSAGSITVTGGKGSTYGIYAEYSDVDFKGEITAAGYSYVYGMYAKACDVNMAGEMDITGFGTSTVYGANLVTSGSFTLHGDISLQGNGYAYGVYTTVADIGIAMAEDATIDITSSSTKAARGIQAYNSVFTMTGGEITVSGSSNSPSGVYTGAGSVISGGAITLNDQPDGYTSQFMGIVEVIGGTFNFDPSAYVRAYTHEAVENDGIWWTVSEVANTVVNVQNTTSNETYANLQDALDDAEEGETLQLQNDYAAGGAAFTIDKGITLDLNQYDITGTAANIITIHGGNNAGAPVIITDTTAASSATMGKISTTGANAITLSDEVEHHVQLKNIGLESIYYGVQCNDGVSNGRTQLDIDGVTIDTVRPSSSGIVYCVAASLYVDIMVTETDSDNFPTVFTADNSVGSTSNCCVFYNLSGATINITGGTFNAFGGAFTSTTVYNCGIYFNSESSSEVNISGGYWTVSNKGTVSQPMIIRYNNYSDTVYGTNTNISGGYYNVAPNEGYLEDGYVLQEDASIAGYSYTVSASPLATVGETAYNSLSDAIAAVAEGGTITLLRDVTLASTLAIAKDFVIEYGENTVTYMGSPAVTVASGMTLPTTIDAAQFDATIVTSAGVTEYYTTLSKAISAASTSETVVLNGDATMDGTTISKSLKLDLAGHSITLNDDGTLACQGGFGSASSARTLHLINSSETAGVIYGGVSVTSYGGQYTVNVGENVEIRDNSPMAVLGYGTEDSVVVNIYGKLIVEVADGEATGATISGNGNGSNDGTTINIYDGAELYGTVTAIYHPQDGKLNIYGGTITGDTGSAIEIKGGTVNITGGTLVSNAEVSHTASGSGTSTTGYAVALVENNSYVTSGNLVSITISGGTFEGDVAKVVDSTRTGEEILTISGGDYAVQPSDDLLIDGYTTVLVDDYYVLRYDTSTAQNFGSINAPYTTIVYGDEYFAEPAVTILVDGQSVTLEGAISYTYGETTGDYDTIIDAIVAAGLSDGDGITVSYTLTATGDYAGTITGDIIMAYAIGTVSYSAVGNTIFAKLGDETIGKISVTAPEDLTYTGEAKIATIYKENSGVLSVEPLSIVYDTTDGTAPIDAGTYTASVTTEGVTASITFAISKAAVTVMVEDNIFAEGDTPAVSISNDLNLVENIDYTVAYYDEDGNAVTLSSTTEAGIYTVAITFADGNYKLAGAVDSVVVYEAEEPAQYTVTFDERDGSAVNDLSAAIATTVRTLAEAPTYDGYTFVGWAYDGKLYTAGAEFIQPDNNVEMTAIWVMDSFRVYGMVTDENGDAVANQAMSMVDAVGNAVYSAITDANGNYAFADVAMGAYHIVATRNVDGVAITTTTYVYVTEDTEVDKILMDFALTTTVSVAPELEQTTVAGLENVAAAQANGVEASEVDAVEVKVTVASANNDEALDAMDSVSNDVGYTMDITVDMIVDTYEITLITETPALLSFTIDLPTEMQGMAYYTVLRYHDYDDGRGPVVDILTTTRNGENEYIELITTEIDGEAVVTALTIHAKFFSTYAITSSDTVPSTDSSTSVRNTYYDIDVEDADNGTVTVSSTRAVEGKTITITATPDEGYEIDDVIVLDEDDDEIDVDDEGDGEYTFEMPDEDVTIEVTFVAIDEDDEEAAVAFLDVDTDAYYYDAVLWAVENDITNGMTEYLFAPDTVCTRAQAVTFLWNAAGNPTVFIENPFEDVSEDAWYYEAVLWAVSEGITSGTTETTFAPDATCTRAQIVTFLWNAAGNSVVDDEMDFADVAADSWYAEAVRWAVSEAITTGMTATEFAPATNCTRGQIVTFLYRYLGE